MSAPSNITCGGRCVGDERFLDASAHAAPVVRENRLDDPHCSAISQGVRRPR